MPWRVRCRALGLALLTATIVGGAPKAGAGSVDCWLLDGSRLDQAREKGLCGDAFSRNSQAGVPPAVAKPASPVPGVKPAAASAPMPTTTPASPAAKPKRERARTVKAVRPARSAGTDFATSFRNDLNALLRALEGDTSGAGRGRDRGRASVPSHMSHTGR